MQTANQILQAMHKMGERRIPLARVYRDLFSEDLFLAAYNKIYRNKGALTPGVGGETVDGMSKKRIHKLIEELRNERFRFHPSRRIHVPKKSGGTRPLSIPGFPEKMVQEVLRMLLEAYYEPRFRDCSHGFRPKRGCHTALTAIQGKFRGAAWFIEGDIQGCFDHIDHEVLMGILSRDIQDGRLLNLIRLCLKAGIMEQWEYHKTYSGTPQGGILSPLLANIYLHELDAYVEDVLIPQYTRGECRAENPVYRRVQERMKRARKRNDIELASKSEQELRRLPSRDTHDPNFRRLVYIRYADDFILAFSGPKSEAEAIKATIGEFLQDRLNLEISPTKTLVTHARTQQAKFLGYAISIQHRDDKVSPSRSRSGKLYNRRSINSHVRLGIPYGLVTERKKRYQRKGKPIQEAALLAFSDADIIEKYQHRFRGLAEYYKFAVDRWRLSELQYAMEKGLVKTLANKYKTSVTKIYRKYRGSHRVEEHDYPTLRVEVPTKKGSHLSYFGAIPLKVVKPGSEPLYDRLHYEPTLNVRSDLIQRLQADTCELCGSHENCQVHHIRKLADLKKPGRKQKPEWVKRMIAMQRKTLVVCHKCHVDIHSGRATPNARA